MLNKKMVKLCVLLMLVVLSVTPNVFATNTYGWVQSWTGDTTRNWNNAYNWSYMSGTPIGAWGVGMPDSTTWIAINYPGTDAPGPIIYSGTNVAVAYAQLTSAPSAANVASLTVSGGSINIADASATYAFIGGYGQNGVLYVNSGTLSASGTVYLGGGGGSGTGTGTLTQNGGYVNIASLLIGDTGAGTWTLNSGIADIQGLSVNRFGTGSGVIDIHSGTLNVFSTPLSDIQAMIDDGKIIGYGGTGYVSAVNSGTKTIVTASATAPIIEPISYTPISYDKETIASDANWVFYGVSRGAADPAIGGQQIYAVTGKTGAGALIQYRQNSNVWTGNVLRTGTKKYLTVLAADAYGGDTGGNEWGTAEVYYVSEDEWVQAYKKDGSWNFYSESDVMKGLIPGFKLRADPNMGAAIAVATPPNTVSGSQSFNLPEIWWGGNDYSTGQAHSVASMWDATNGRIWDLAGQFPSMDIATGNALSRVSMPSWGATTECVHGGQYNIAIYSGNGTWYYKGGWTNGNYYHRSVAIGDVRPAASADINDPWKGNEIVSFGTVHPSWDYKQPMSAWFMDIANWKNPGDPCSLAEDIRFFPVDGNDTVIPRRVAIGDLDDDGHNDIVVAFHGTKPALRIYSWDTTLNDYVVQTLDDSKNYWDVKLVDIDGSGRLDILYAADGEIGILHIRIPGDLNGDGRVDFKDFALMALHWLE